MTEVQERPAETEAAEGFSFTMPSTDFAAALKAVSLFSCTDQTLPAICSVQVALSGRQLVFRATDRFTLATQVVELAPEDAQGEGELVLPSAIVKTLAAVKSGTHGSWVVTFTVPAEGGLHIALPEGGSMSYPAREFEARGQFPRVQRLLDGWKPEEGDERTLGFNPAFLARFAKMGKSVTLTPGEGRLVKFTCGDVVGLIVRMTRDGEK